VHRHRRARARLQVRGRPSPTWPRLTWRSPTWPVPLGPSHLALSHLALSHLASRCSAAPAVIGAVRTLRGVSCALVGTSVPLVAHAFRAAVLSASHGLCFSVAAALRLWRSFVSWEPDAMEQHPHPHAHTRTHARTHAHSRACMLAHARTHACTQEHTCMHLHACTCTCTHARTYARTHTRARTHTCALVSVRTIPSGERLRSCFENVVAVYPNSIETLKALHPRPPPSRRLPKSALLRQPHLRRDWAHPAHICPGTGRIPPTSAPRLGSPVQRATSAPVLGAPRPHLRRDWQPVLLVQMLSWLYTQQAGQRAQALDTVNRVLVRRPACRSTEYKHVAT
jgi:hypothetical protein